MKLLRLTPIFKRFKKVLFFSSLNQNTCPMYDAEEIKNKNNKKLLKSYTQKKRALASPQSKSGIIPITLPFIKS